MVQKSFNRILLPGGNSFDNGDIDLTMPYIIDDYTETEVLDPVAQPHTPPPITLPPPPPPPSPPSTPNFLSLSLRRRPSITALDTYTISPYLAMVMTCRLWSMQPLISPLLLSLLAPILLVFVLFFMSSPSHIDLRERRPCQYEKVEY